MTTRRGFRSFPSPRLRRHPTRCLDSQGLRQPRPRAPSTMRRVASCTDARAGPMGRSGSGSVCVTARKGPGGAAHAGARSPRAGRRTLTACSKSARPRREICMGRCDLGAGRCAHSVPLWAGDRHAATLPPRAWLLIVMDGLHPPLPDSPTFTTIDIPARCLKARPGQAGSGL
jgi:hypothetical protein